MKKYTFALLTFWSFTCQAFNGPLVEETDKKMLWYRQIQLEANSWNLSNLIKDLEQDPCLIFERLDELKRIHRGFEDALGLSKYQQDKE